MKLKELAAEYGIEVVEAARRLKLGQRWSDTTEVDVTDKVRVLMGEKSRA
jgi:uncharacterized protein YjcR